MSKLLLKGTLKRMECLLHKLIATIIKGKKSLLILSHNRKKKQYKIEKSMSMGR